jgi:hypothetical protein
VRLAVRTFFALALVSAGVLAGCGGGLNIEPPPVVGPLFDASTPTRFCLSTARGAAVAVGWDLLEEDAGSAPARITSVVLADPSNLRLVGALAVPVRQGAQLGNGWNFPLTAIEVGEVSQGVEWAERRPAIGAEVSPLAAGDDTNLVVGVATTSSAPGSATGLTVAYEAGKHHFVITLPTAVTVDNLPASC